MALASGNALGKKLLEALGLPWENVHALTIHCAADGVAEIVVERFLTNEDGERAEQVMLHYAIHELEVEED